MAKQDMLGAKLIKVDKLTSTEGGFSNFRDEIDNRPKLIIRRIDVEKNQSFPFDSELDTPMSHQLASSERSMLNSQREISVKIKTQSPVKRSTKKFAKSLIFSNARISASFNLDHFLSNLVSSTDSRI